LRLLRDCQTAQQEKHGKDHHPKIRAMRHVGGSLGGMKNPRFYGRGY
jgi:hypothetical protein